MKNSNTPTPQKPARFNTPNLKTHGNLRGFWRTHTVPLDQSEVRRGRRRAPTSQLVRALSIGFLKKPLPRTYCCKESEESQFLSGDSCPLNSPVVPQAPTHLFCSLHAQPWHGPRTWRPQCLTRQQALTRTPSCPSSPLRQRTVCLFVCLSEHVNAPPERTTLMPIHTHGGGTGRKDASHPGIPSPHPLKQREYTWSEFGMQNRTIGPCLAAMHRILISAMVAHGGPIPTRMRDLSNKRPAVSAYWRSPCYLIISSPLHHLRELLVLPIRTSADLTSELIKTEQLTHSMEANPAQLSDARPCAWVNLGSSNTWTCWSVKSVYACTWTCWPVNSI
jgi:hypothetical protein